MDFFGGRTIMKKWVLFILLVTSPVFAQTGWDRVKGDCEQKFLNYQQVKLNELELCMKFWEAYRNINALKPEKRSFMASVFERVFVEADKHNSYLAQVAMTRLGSPPGQDEFGKRQKFKHRKAVKKRRRYIPVPVSKSAKKRAKRIRAKAMRYYKHRKYDKAIELLDKALKTYPGYIQALYDEACARALTGDKANAIEYLMRIRDLKKAAGYKKLRLARKDKDFISIRETPEFKNVTGYAHVKLLNGMSQENQDIGDDNVSILKDLMARLDYPPEVIGLDKHVRTRPIIWYKKPSKAVAYVLKKLINHPHVLLVPIDWNSKFDIIVSWADKVGTSPDGVRQVKYSMAGGKFDPDKKVASVLKEEDKMLCAPDEYAAKADKIASAPANAVNKVDSTVKKIEGIGKKVKNVGKVFKKLKSPF